MSYYFKHIFQILSFNNKQHYILLLFAPWGKQNLLQGFKPAVCVQRHLSHAYDQVMAARDIQRGTSSVAHLTWHIQRGTSSVAARGTMSGQTLNFGLSKGRSLLGYLVVSVHLYDVSNFTFNLRLQCDFSECLTKTLHGSTALQTISVL